jgi:hypothetical protein
MRINYLLVILVLLILLPGITSAATIVHPILLFKNIEETPGYQYRTIAPWKGWEATIMQSANGALKQNYSSNLGVYDRLLYRGGFARDLGFAYQITKQPKYSDKAREALLNMDIGTVPYSMDRSEALGAYSLAYDWIQPTLDPATDTIIRDKLATMADTVYKELNNNGKNRGYVTFADYHGKAYPLVGVASAALSDYMNPNNLPLSSTPSDWHKVGKEYLFENDQLHLYNRSLFSFGFDEESGKFLNGEYKSYVISELSLWFQVSAHAYGENLLDMYPAAKKAVTSETWESLPNDYNNNYCTNGNIGWTYQKGIVSLLPDVEKGPVLNHIERLEHNKVLPYGSIYGGVSGFLLYSNYGNYTSIPRLFPKNASYLDPRSIFQVFRKNWNNDSDWLSIITWNYVSNSNRDMAHNDQASIEYYSRGDLLLADAGEDKYVLDRNYGRFEIHHNTIAIENPRSAFSVAGWSGSPARGMYKGDTGRGQVTPAIVHSVLQVPWMESIDVEAKINQVIGSGFGNSQPLSSPIYYNRVVLFPDAEYFIVIDRMEGTESWVYRTIYRPTSLRITPTVDKNKDKVYAATEVGHVNGSLTIGTTPINWEGLPFKTETDTGITTNTVKWNTVNPYGNNVELNIVSEPASDIKVTKLVGRIAGYDAPSEVYSPVVWFTSPASENLYRITALLSRYPNEEAKSSEKISVQGTGNALKIHSSGYDDYIYTGTGNSTFAGFSTDSDTAFIRQRGAAVEITLLSGSHFDYQNERWVDLSKKADYVTVKKDNGTIDYRIQADPDLRGELFSSQIDPVKIHERANTDDQTNTVITGSQTAPDTGFVSDFMAFIKKIGKQVISFLKIRI